MFSLSAGKETVRRSFGKIKDIVPVPNLIEVQSRSFNEFAQLDYLPEERQLIGLEKVFRNIFPISYRLARRFLSKLNIDHFLRFELFIELAHREDPEEDSAGDQRQKEVGDREDRACAS